MMQVVPPLVLVVSVIGGMLFLFTMFLREKDIWIFTHLCLGILLLSLGIVAF